MSEDKIFKPINVALDEATDLLNYLQRSIEFENIAIVGDLRRRVELLSEIVLLIASGPEEAVIEALDVCNLLAQVNDYSVDNFLAKTASGLDLRIRFCQPEYFGYEKFIFTAAPAFLDAFMQDNSIDANDCIGLDEEAIFALVDLPYLPATVREDYSQCLKYRSCDYVDLLSLDDIKADLHVHSTYSDGRNSIELLADRAKSMNYSYIGISDHSQSLTVARGLSVKDLKAKSHKINELNASEKKFKVLCGVEVDILKDGSLDYPDSALELADYVIGSVHVDTKMPYQRMTERMLRAVNSGKIDILGHPTGRMFDIRESLDFDIDAVMKACAENRVAMEISGYTIRLDLNDRLTAKAKEYGCIFACGTDAHYVDCLDSMKYAVWIAQRAWLKKSDIINCLEYDQLIDFIRNRRMIFDDQKDV